jgi:RND family efflux transporter MFP subunit
MDLEDPSRARKQGRPIPVRTAQVTAGPIEQTIGATAITAASHECVIRALAQSRGLNTTDIILKAVRVREGDHVHQGQVLFEIEDDVRGNVVKQREAALAAAKAELERVKQAVAYNHRIRNLDLASAEANLKYRTEDLDNRKQALDIFAQLRRDKAANVLEYQDARSKHAQARFDLSEAERILQRAQDALSVGLLRDKEDVAKSESNVVAAAIDFEEGQRDVAWCQIKSALDGFIDSKVDVVAGQVLAVTSGLARVIQLNPIHVRLDFPQERMGDVFVGQKAEVVLDSFPKETFAGTVVRISPIVNPQLRVFPVVVELPNPDYRIKAGISGFVRVHVTKTATTVPSTAVIQHGTKAMVFRVEDGRARLREVRCKHLAELGALEVTDGLRAGDEVVIYHSNFYRHWGELGKRDCYLQDNDPVDVDWRKWARRE